MRVLVYEQFHPGHHYYYLHFLLPALLEITSDVVVAITREGRASAEFTDLLAPFTDRVAFEAILPYGHDRVIKNEKWALHRDLRDAVRRTRPDYVLAPSADSQTTAMGLFRMAGLGGLPGQRRGEAGFHLGRGVASRSLMQAGRDRLHELKLAASGWTRHHIVNLLFYEHLQARGGVLARKSSLLPHPVKANPYSKAESRRLLGIPADGRVIGVAGLIDYRKAVAELLAAFRRSSDRPSDRVLLAGPLDRNHRQTIETSYKDLADSGRIIMLDRFMTSDQNQRALAAMDVVCTPYPGFVALSSVLLEGLAAGRPVLSNNLGWCEAIVKRFDAGWTCDLMNPEAFAQAIRTALDECESYRHTEATSRLLAFHAPENFAASFLKGLRSFANLPPSPELRPWSWVLPTT
jgi:glycosyltransferase involved in cell wall biosynthesis